MRILLYFPVILLTFLIFITQPSFTQNASDANKPAAEESANKKNESGAETNNAGKDNAFIPEIKLNADKTKISFGEIVKLNIEYNLPEGSVFNLADDLKGLEDFAITEKTGSGNKLNLSVIIDKPESFDMSVSLSFKDKKGEKTIIKSEPVHFEISSNLGAKPEEAQLKPIQDIIPTYPLWLKLLPWIAGVLIVGIGVLVFLYIRKKKKAIKYAAAEIREPHVIAEEEIKKLVTSDLIRRGAYKEFYFRLSEIIRIYIESLRGFPAVDLTTEEIVRKIKNEKDRNIIPLLRWMDMVKFADSIPSGDRNEIDVKAALDYIKDTTLVKESLGNL